MKEVEEEVGEEGEEEEGEEITGKGEEGDSVNSVEELASDSGGWDSESEKKDVMERGREKGEERK